MEGGVTYPLLSRVHVNVPFCMLQDRYLDFVLENRINPEIGLDAQALDTVATSEFRECADAIRKKGLGVSFHGPFADLAAGSSDSKIRSISRQRFEQVLGLVPIFQPKTVVCHTGFETFRHGYMKQQWTENSLPIWSWFSKELKALGSLLVLENVFEKTPTEFLPVFKTLPKTDVGFCLDVGHQSAFSRSTLKEWLDILGPYLRQLHLHDNDGTFDSHLALGKGRVDFRTVFNFLAAMDGDRPLITLEPHVEEDLWPSLSYLDKRWPWGREAPTKSVSFPSRL